MVKFAETIFIVHVFNGSYFGTEDVKLKTTDYEQPFWGGSKYFLEREKFMPNLQVIIPLMEYSLTNWVIYDNGPSEIGKPHTFSITVNTDD